MVQKAEDFRFGNKFNKQNKTIDFVKLSNFFIGLAIIFKLRVSEYGRCHKNIKGSNDYKDILHDLIYYHPPVISYDNVKRNGIAFPFSTAMGNILYIQ